jgi:hypothetical protein
MPLSPANQAALNSSKSLASHARSTPLWKGPEVDGVTQSLLGAWLFDRERFRLMVVEGLRERERFNHRLEYGNLWHVCEEATAGKKDYKKAVLDYCKKLATKYRDQQVEVEKWYQICLVQYPIYLKYWSQHPDVKARKPIFQEEVFDVDVTLPSGRKIKLKGKWDSVDDILSAVFIQENKTKGEFEEAQIAAELPNDLQSNFYLTALEYDPRLAERIRTGKFGVRYNVVRRPLAGGKHSIQQLKGRATKTGLKGAETTEAFYKRRGEQHIAADPKFFFSRLRMEVTLAELHSFQRRCLFPILEQLLDWWEWIVVDPFDPWRDRRAVELNPELFWGTADAANPKAAREEIEYENPPKKNRVHWMTPFGIYNPLADGRSTVYDNYIASGDETGLSRVSTLYPELEKDDAPSDTTKPAQAVSKAKASGPKPIRRSR